jgi:hypothetical protein
MIKAKNLRLPLFSAPPSLLGKGAGGLGLLCLCLMPVRAQKAPPNTPPDGYEDLIAAGKLADESKPLQGAIQPDATLQQKRLATIDDKMDKALRTLRDWLNQPGRTVPSIEASRSHPWIQSQLRTLARALMVEQYVYLASGRVGAAIDSARDGLRMCNAVAPDDELVQLTDEAVDTIVIQTVAKHLDQLSQTDCKSLLALARDWMAVPDPTVDLIEAERKRSLEQYRRLAAAEVDVKSPGVEAALPALKNANKADFVAFCQQAGANYSRLLSAYEAKLNRPLWELLDSTPEPRTALSKQRTWADLAIMTAESQFASYRLMLQQSLVVRGEQQARARMVGCHAAIRDYRWEHDSLPNSLDELKLGKMAVDPFTGESFIYKPTADKRGYTLQSAGPPTLYNQNKSKPGERQPFALIPNT